MSWRLLEKSEAWLRNEPTLPSLAFSSAPSMPPEFCELLIALNVSASQFELMLEANGELNTPPAAPGTASVITHTPFRTSISPARLTKTFFAPLTITNLRANPAHLALGQLNSIQMPLAGLNR